MEDIRERTGNPEIKDRSETPDPVEQNWKNKPPTLAETNGWVTELGERRDIYRKIVDVANPYARARRITTYEWLDAYKLRVRIRNWCEYVCRNGFRDRSDQDELCQELAKDLLIPLLSEKRKSMSEAGFLAVVERELSNVPDALAYVKKQLMEHS